MTPERIHLDIDHVGGVLSETLARHGVPPLAESSLTANAMTAEMAQKYSHGLARAIWIMQNLQSGERQFSDTQEVTYRQVGNTLSVDGQGNIGCFVFDNALDESMGIAKTSGSPVLCGITNIGPFSGYISHFALKAMRSGFGFLSFVDSPGGLIPHGANRELWGTNPITMGIPDKHNPILIDLSLGQETWGDYFLGQLLGQDEVRKFATPPIAGHKGSALVLLTKILAGVLTRTQGIDPQQRTAGVFFMLFKPSLFTDTDHISDSINEVVSQVTQDSDARIPGQQAIHNISEAERLNQIFTYNAVWQRLKGL